MTHRVARALVTGGAGFIGSHLVDALLEHGTTVMVVDNFSTGKLENLRGRIEDPALQVVRGDIVDAGLVDRLVMQAEIIYHLAAAVGVTHVVRDPLGSVLTNVRGTENVLAAAHRHQVPVLIASSSEVYGKSAATPFREDGERVLGPTWIHRWSYSTAKAIDEHLAFAYADAGLPVSIVRYFNAYGPRLDERGYGSVVARFAAQALAGEPLTVHGDGTQSRCFTYVSDTVRGTILAAETDAARGTVLNIGSDEETSIVGLAEMVRDILASPSSIEYMPYESYYGSGFEDTRRRVPDIRRAKELLGFTATVRLRDGLARTLEWCRRAYAAGRRRDG